MLNQTVFNTSEICFQLGVKHAVFSPGSRNAPLIVSFSRNSKITKKIIPDERAAGFVALGIAQYTKEPVVLCCTSGTALLNYAPAIAEAYYRQIPLIVLSADRPPELIDQRDGQTIRQFEVLKNHVKTTVQLPVVEHSKDEDHYEKSLVGAVQKSTSGPKGPVHINVPFREPFYPANSQDLKFTSPKYISDLGKQRQEMDFDIPPCRKVLVLIGQNEFDNSIIQLTNEVAEILPVIRSPLNNLENGINHVDGFINNQDELVPDLLITSGLSVLSKKLKQFLKTNKPSLHLHFDPDGVPVDTFQSEPRLVKQSIDTVLHRLMELDLDPSYLKKWEAYESACQNTITEEMKTGEFSEATATKQILAHLQEGSLLHLSNSMPVRYADLFGLKKGVQSFCNRGTSGIDGCTSTAVGTALVTEERNVLITGDVAFFYDTNAFFHNYKVPNLKVIIMNNQGGGIFRLIDGPSGLPELEEYFETRHQLTAEYICAQNGFDYYPVGTQSELESHLGKVLAKSEKTTVMEVFTEPEVNQRVYKKLRKSLNEQVSKLEESL